MQHQSAFRRGARVALLVPVVLAAVIGCSQASAGGARTTYGKSVALGRGTARAYITMAGGRPVEVGVALSERALEGLPDAHGSGGHHVMGHTTFEHVLEMPDGNPTAFRHVLLNWNPGGHEPPGLYDTQHLDFHFYTLENAERLAIDEADPEFQAKGERMPPADLVPERYILPAPLVFPRMGVHWVDPASPELNGKPFTATFIYGSYDGKVIFAEPMITKAFLESKPQFSAALPQPARGRESGGYPSQYHVRWDAQAKEWRIAISGFAS